MKLLDINEQLVSKSDLLRNYNECKTKVDKYGEIVVLTNNKPDVVIINIDRYNLLNKMSDYLEQEEIYNIIKKREDLKSDIPMEEVFELIGLDN